MAFGARPQDRVLGGAEIVAAPSRLCVAAGKADRRPSRYLRQRPWMNCVAALQEPPRPLGTPPAFSMSNLPKFQFGPGQSAHRAVDAAEQPKSQTVSLDASRRHTAGGLRSGNVRL